MQSIDIPSWSCCRLLEEHVQRGTGNFFFRSDRSSPSHSPLFSRFFSLSKNVQIILCGNPPLPCLRIYLSTWSQRSLLFHYSLYNLFIWGRIFHFVIRINPAYTKPFVTTILLQPGPTGLQGNRTVDAITRNFLGKQASWSPWWVHAPFLRTFAHK